jgi:hypothetical protein
VGGVGEGVSGRCAFWGLPKPLVRATLSEHLGFWQASRSLGIGATLSCHPILFGNCYGLFLGAAPGGRAALPGAAVYLRVHAGNGPSGPGIGAGAHGPRVPDPGCAPDDVLLDWAATPDKPLAGQLVFLAAQGGSALETLGWEAGQCVGY